MPAALGMVHPILESDTLVTLNSERDAMINVAIDIHHDSQTAA